jgi:GR25 family glycosyltransferase involved in LPS biosynthesis
MTTVKSSSLSQLCVAILGEMPAGIIEDLSDAGITTDQVHSIPFVEASTRSEWLNWQRVLGTKELGIGRGSAGCLLAHRDAWLTFNSCNHEYLLVLEDDVILTKYGKRHFAESLGWSVKSGLSLIHLGDHVKFSPGKLARLLAQLNLREFAKITYERFFLKFLSPRFVENQFPFSGHAYVLKTEFARVISQYSENFLYPVDVHLNAISQVSKNKAAKVRTPILVQAEKRESQIKQRGR